MDKKSISLALLGIAVVISIIVFWRSSVTIEEGKAGVLYRQFGGGTVTDEPALEEGFHIIAPWNKVIKYDIRKLEQRMEMTVLSKNGLDITVEVSVLYKPDASKLGLLHKKIGSNYLNVVVEPQVKSATREVIGKYDPEELYASKRDLIQGEIFSSSVSTMKDQYVILDKILIRNIELPPSIKTAIENKLKQEQASKEYEFKLTKQQKEAERIKIEAQGKADANEILNKSLTDKILKEKGIQATLELAKAPGSKIVIIGNSKDGLPIILGDN